MGDDGMGAGTKPRLSCVIVNVRNGETYWRRKYHEQSGYSLGSYFLSPGVIALGLLLLSFDNCNLTGQSSE